MDRKHSQASLQGYCTTMLGELSMCYLSWSNKYCVAIGKMSHQFQIITKMLFSSSVEHFVSKKSVQSIRPKSGSRKFLFRFYENYINERPPMPHKNSMIDQRKICQKNQHLNSIFDLRTKRALGVPGNKIFCQVCSFAQVPQ